MSLSSSNFISTTCAVRVNTVSSVGAIREDGGRDGGGARSRSSATLDSTGVKFTWAASWSLRVLTGQRSSPQAIPTGNELGGDAVTAPLAVVVGVSAPVLVGVGELPPQASTATESPKASSIKPVGFVTGVSAACSSHAFKPLGRLSSAVAGTRGYQRFHLHSGGAQLCGDVAGYNRPANVKLRRIEYGTPQAAIQ